MTIKKIGRFYVATVNNVDFVSRSRISAMVKASTWAWAWLKAQKSIELNEFKEVSK